MYFSDISVYQIPSHFRPKYTNLHQSHTNLARKPTILYMQSAKSYAIHQYTKSYTNFAKDMVIYGDLCPLLYRLPFSIFC